jgi:hypothetical protein
MKLVFLTSLLFVGVLMLTAAAQENSGAKGAKPSSGQDKTAAIKEALSAAPSDVAKTAKVLDWDGKVLKEGSGAYTCYPTPPPMKKIGKSPMCLDKTWQGWADAWLSHKDFKADRIGIAYMLEGDTGASNTDPFAQGRTSDNQWVVSGPHTMVLVPDPKQLEGLSTDPNNGGPFVMWKGTPYAHIMVPVGKHPSGGSHMGSMDMGSKPKSH